MQFQYNTLVDRENICNRQEEIKALTDKIMENRPVIIYAPRRYGKTSILHNIIKEEFAAKKKSLVLFIDLMNANSIDLVIERIHTGVSHLISESMPLKSWSETIKQYFSTLKVNISIDPMMQTPSINIESQGHPAQKSLTEIFNSLLNIRKKYNILIIFDEFQDAVQDQQSAGLLRSHLQKLTKTPIVFSGSKRKLLEKIFQDYKSGLYNFGDSLYWNAISADEWLPYFNERLKTNKLRITISEMHYICEHMLNVPNSICQLGYELTHCGEKGQLTLPQIEEVVKKLVRKQAQSFRFQIGLMTKLEQQVYRSVALKGFVDEITGQQFTRSINGSTAAIRKIANKFVLNGFFEWEFEKGYRVSNPIMGLFVKYEGL